MRSFAGKIFTFGVLFSLFIVFFQQKILHFRLSATCFGMLAVHVHRECENEKFLIGYKYSTFSPFFQMPIRVINISEPFFLAIFSHFFALLWPNSSLFPTKYSPKYDHFQPKQAEKGVDKAKKGVDKV